MIVNRLDVAKKDEKEQGKGEGKEGKQREGWNGGKENGWGVTYSAIRNTSSPN